MDYDETLVDYARLLDVFFANVDPFDGGGQFIDRGHSYTLAVYFQTAEEEAAARAKRAAVERAAGKPAAVSIEPLGPFWTAEEYHQNFYLKQPEAFAEELRKSGRKQPE